MLMSLLVRVSGCGQGIFHSLHETLRSYFKLLYHRYLEQAESGDWTVWVGGVSHDHPSLLCGFHTTRYHVPCVNQTNACFASNIAG